MLTETQTPAQRIRNWQDTIVLLEDKMAGFDQEITMIQQRMLESATQHLIGQGKSPDEAKKLAMDALNAAPEVPLPTFEELDD